MKKITTLIISVLLTLTMFGQREAETIEKAKDLMAHKKYESAYNLLDGFDPKNTNPDIVLIKEDIALNYFVSSLMHQSFAYVDMEEDKDIRDYRGKEGSFGMKPFAINKILDSLIIVYPNNCKLYKGLGDFYYQVHLKYGGKWLIGNDELLKLIETNFRKAIDGKCEDYFTYFIMGYICIVQGKFNDGIPYFLKSIKINKDFASSYYNIAYAYLNIDNKDSVLKYAKLSYDMDTDFAYKSEAARMLGQVYSAKLDGEKAIANYELADKIDSGNYFNLKPLLNLYIQTGNAKAGETTKRFFNLEPTNPTIFNDIDEIYLSNNKEKELIAFYKEQLPAFNDNPNVLGNLNFYLGKNYINTDKKLAKEYFLKAKEIFIIVYEKDHPVFKVLEDGINQTEKE